MAEVDRVEVKVTPDLDGFRAKVHAELSRIKDLQVKIDPDVTGFRQKVQAELAGMRASVGVDVDRDRVRSVATGVTRALRAEAPAMKRTVAGALSEAVDEGYTKAVKDASREEENSRRRVLNVERQIQRTKDRMLVLSREMARTDEKDHKSIALLQKEYDKLAASQKKLKFELDADRGGLARASAQLRAAQARLQAQASANPVKQPVEVDIDRNSLRRVSSSLTSVTGSAFRFAGTTVGVAGIGVAASTAAAGLGAMVVQAVPLAAALAQASGAALLIPGALLGGAAAAATLAVGMSGVTEAFKNSGDPEKYAESLAKLTPAAQDFVKAGVGLKDVLADIKAVVQENLFQGLGDELRDWQRDLFPALKTGMANIAGGLNDVVRDLMRTLGSAKVSQAIETLFGNTSRGLSAASGGFSGFTEGLIGLASAGSRFFEELGQSFTNAGENFADWVDRISENGDLDRWIRNGIDAFKDIGSILGNIGSGLASIFRAAREAGGDMLGRFDAVTERFASWAKSDEGQDSLTGFFTQVRRVTDALTPVAGALFGVVGHIAEGAADIAVAFAPFAEKVLNNLEPVVDTIARILEDVAPPFGEFLDVISQSLGPAFENLGPGVKDLFQALADSAPAIGEVLEAAGSIGGAVLEGIADVLPTIADWLSRLAGFLEDVVDAIGPLPAAIGAFLAALAIGGGGKGGKGKGIGKGWIALAGGAAVVDAASKGVPESAAEAAAQWVEGFAGGVAAGWAIGGPIGAAIGGITGTVAAFGPTYKEAGKSLWNTFKNAVNPDDVAWDEEYFSWTPGKGIVQEVKGKATPDKENVDAWKDYYAAIEELYKIDFDSAKEWDDKKLKSTEEVADAALAIEEEYQAKYGELAARGPAEIERAEKASLDRRQKSAIENFGTVESEHGVMVEGIISGAEKVAGPWRRASQDISDSQKKTSTEVKTNVDGLAGGIVAAADKSKDGWRVAAAGMSSSNEDAAKKSNLSWQGIVPAIKGAASSTEGAWKKAGTGIGSGVSQTTTGAKQKWQGAYAYIRQGATSTSSGLTNAFRRAGDAGQNSANRSKGAWFSFASSAGSSVNGFYNLFNNSKPQAASRAQAQGAVAQWAGMHGQGSYVGGMFGQGLADGINSRSGQVEGAAARLAEIAARAARLAARVSSPSRVAMEIGGWWGEGLAVGIEQKAARVGHAATAAMNAANVSAVGAGSLESPGFPDKVTLLDRNGSLLGHMDVRTDRAVTTYDSSQSRLVKFGVSP
ncbi:hypothetical protein [Cumulibacter soli]|uniref:hypothetical protein n=1 Tax=Cumulibacter soli TaxID=2546344 RepID=UPI0010681529|nr:hypothetical protein [Cumulibacter soli]